MQAAAASPPESGPRNESTNPMLEYAQRVARRVRRTFGTEVPQDDLVAYGLVGFLEARRRFDPAHGTSLEHFAFQRTYGAMIDGARDWSQRRRVRFARRRLNATRSEPAGGPAGALPASPVTDIGGLRPASAALGGPVEPWYADASGRPAADMPSLEARITDARMLDALEGVLETLRTAERELIDLYYFEEQSMSEVAQHMGITKSWVSRLHGIVLGKLRARLSRRFPPGATAE